MANQLATNPWVIDTTGPNILYNGMIKDAQFEYTDYTDPGHHVEVFDRNGRTVARLKGSTDLSTVRTGKVGWIQGLKIPSTDSDQTSNMQSGKVLVYFG